MKKRVGLAIYARTYIQTFIPRLAGLFGEELMPRMTPTSEGYHPEIDDTPL
jgi:hypothetical protein